MRVHLVLGMLANMRTAITVINLVCFPTLFPVPGRPLENTVLLESPHVCFMCTEFLCNYFAKNIKDLTYIELCEDNIML
jgi:hypothetical protein